MKRLLSLLSLLVLAFLVVGCVKGPDNVEDAAAKINWDVDLSNPKTLKAIYPSTGISGFGYDDSAKIIEKTTGYKIEYSELSDANADNDVANIFLNQDKYQILKLSEAQYHPNVKDGSLLDLTPLLENTEAGRILYELIDLTPYGWDACRFTKADGTVGIYAVPDFGYSVMEDSALVWNTEHLKAVGYTNLDGSARAPENITELTDCLTKLQAKYGKDSEYHAFTIPGSNCSNMNCLMSAFGVANEFYIDNNGNIQYYIFSDQIANYVEYLNMLRDNSFIPKTWQNADNSSCISNFSDEKCSCMFIQYWWVESLVKSIVAKGTLAAKASVTNDYQTAHDELIIWNTRMRGDGSYNSENQTKAKFIGGTDGISFYTAIPYYMAEDAVYVIDFLSKKMMYFSEYYGGTGLSLAEKTAGKLNDGTKVDEDYITNNVHWMEVEAPEGAESYYDKDDYSFQQYEDYTAKIIYLRPYSYEIEYEIDPKLSHVVADGETKTIESNCQKQTYTLNGTKMKYKVEGGGKWVQLTERYMSQIVDNSQYCNGTNSISANILFHLRETGFDAWQVTVPFDETVITNPMSMMPPLEHWAPISILSRTVAKRGVASAIDDTTSTPTKALNVTRQSMLQKYNKAADGTKYYYWSDDIVSEMTNWYNTVKKNRK